MGIHSVSLYVRVFITLSHFYLSLIFTGKAGAYPSGDPYKALHYKTFYSSDFGRNVISQSVCHCESLPLSQIFVGKTQIKSTKVEPLTKLISDEKLPSWTKNIRLGWKCLKVVNSLAYFDTAIFTTVKMFHSKDPLQSVKVYVTGSRFHLSQIFAGKAILSVESQQVQLYIIISQILYNCQLQLSLILACKVELTQVETRFTTVSHNHPSLIFLFEAEASLQRHLQVSTLCRNKRECLLL